MKGRTVLSLNINILNLFILHNRNMHNCYVQIHYIINPKKNTLLRAVMTNLLSSTCQRIWKMPNLLACHTSPLNKSEIILYISIFLKIYTPIVSDSQDLPHATYLQAVISFCWQASAATQDCSSSHKTFILEAALGKALPQPLHNPHPILVWFLEASFCKSMASHNFWRFWRSHKNTSLSYVASTTFRKLQKNGAYFWE